MKLKKHHFDAILGEPKTPPKILSHFLSQITPQFCARNQKIPTAGSGGKLRTNGQTDERTNVRRVYHGTFTSYPKSSKKLTWLRRNYQELNLSLIISNCNAKSKSQIKCANYTSKSQRKCDRNFAFPVFSKFLLLSFDIRLIVFLIVLKNLRRVVASIQNFAKTKRHVHNCYDLWKKL